MRIQFFICVAMFAVTFAIDAGEPTPGEIFEKRIVPIFKSPNPSSCVQCHLAGVDLKQYILPSSEKTFVSLRDQGMIDLDSPEKSKILKLISMGEKDRRAAALIHAETRQAEFAAFADWIKACSADPKLRSAPKLDDKEIAKPPRPNEVIRHARKDRLLESFERNVWAMRFRCMSCHIEGTAENDKRRKEFGDRVAWIKKAGAEATMEYLLSSKLINIKNPDQSLLLLKPLGEEEHKGGIKFLPGDLGYKAFRTWIEDVAAIRGDKYREMSDLPPQETGPKRFGTDIWFKLAETPPEWGDKLLQVEIFAWDAAAKAWEKEPIASSDRGVWGKGKLWQHNLTLMAAAGSRRAEAWSKGRPNLPAGRYLVKAYVDHDGREARDWKAALGEADYVGRAEFEARWREGYGGMTVVEARNVRK
jgi:hypothetical protein